MLYRIALTLVPGVGDVKARQLLEYLGSAEAIFSAKASRLEKIPGIGPAIAGSIQNFGNFSRAEAEIRFMEKNNIRPLFISDDDYPERLRHCIDAPILLYFKGCCRLNTARVLSIVGTRNQSEYGAAFTEKIIEELSAHNILIVSGLAEGIDAIAHRKAWQTGLPTVGVLAHGLHTVFPERHKKLAVEIQSNGGLLSEFPSATAPEKMYFPRRNRIVAGMADATLVIESGISGGSMITAELALGYHREVLALPGRCTDSRSAGCLQLIAEQKAQLIRSAADILAFMNWEEKEKKKNQPPRQLQLLLSETEQQVVNLLQTKTEIHIDELYALTGLSSSGAAAAVLQLEMNGILRSLPGKRYQLADP